LCSSLQIEVLLLREPESPSDLLLSLFVIILLLDMKRTADEANLLRTSQGGDSVQLNDEDAEREVAPPICEPTSWNLTNVESPVPPALERELSCPPTQPLTPPPEESVNHERAHFWRKKKKEADLLKEDASVTPTLEVNESPAQDDSHTRHVRAEEEATDEATRDVVFATQENHERYNELVLQLEKDEH
jgi:hypothetical protein